MSDMSEFRALAESYKALVHESERSAALLQQPEIRRRAPGARAPQRAPCESGCAEHLVSTVHPCRGLSIRSLCPGGL